MSLTISIRFLTGRAHLHPWQSHHSEGRVEWPPSHWRLLRAVVAVAGRGLTSLSASDEFSDPAIKPKAIKRNPESVWPLDVNLYEAANEDVRDEIPLSRFTRLLETLSATPSIYLPRTSGGHTRQYFPIHEAGIVKNTGSAVFDTFAAVSKYQPLLFHWPNIELDMPQELDLTTILSRMTYFGRAESWCQARADSVVPGQIDGVVIEGRARTHWHCVCIEDIEDGGKPEGVEFRDYTLERRLAPTKPAKVFRDEVLALLPRTAPSQGGKRKADDVFGKVLALEPLEILLLRCLIRESGQDIKDGLERPIERAGFTTQYLAQSMRSPFEAASQTTID